MSRVFRYLLAALMAGFALLQLNDPDPLPWVVAYALVAICIVIPSGRSAGRHLCWLAAGVILALGLESLPGVLDYLASGDVASLVGDMTPDKPYVEPAREFLGVVIAAAALFGGRRL